MMKTIGNRDKRGLTQMEFDNQSLWLENLINLFPHQRSSAFIIVPKNFVEVL